MSHKHMKRVEIFCKTVTDKRMFGKMAIRKYIIYFKIKSKRCNLTCRWIERDCRKCI